MELNRAVAIAMAFGPAAGLKIVDVLTSEPSLKGYHLLPSARVDLLSKLVSHFARIPGERNAFIARNAARQSSIAW